MESPQVPKIVIRRSGSKVAERQPRRRATYDVAQCRDKVLPSSPAPGLRSPAKDDVKLPSPVAVRQALQRQSSRSSTMIPTLGFLGGLKEQGGSRPGSGRLASKSRPTSSTASTRNSSRSSTALPSVEVGSSRRAASKTRRSLPSEWSTGGMDVVRWPSHFETSEEFSPELLRLSLVRNLARKYHVEQHEVRRVVDLFDRASGGKNGGLLDLAAFRSVLVELYDHSDLNEKGVAAAWQTCTTSRSSAAPAERELDIDAFMAWYCNEERWSQLKASTAWVASEQAIRELAKKHGVPVEVMENVKKAFDNSDTNRTGIVDYTEFRAIIQAKLAVRKASALSEALVQRWWREIDSDDSGEVDFPEFAQWYLDRFDADCEELVGSRIEGASCWSSPRQIDSSPRC